MQFYIHYIRQNRNARYLNLKGTILANVLADTKDCYIFVVAIDLSQFSSITFDSKLQSDVSPLLCFRRPGSLSESFKGDSSWHNTSRKGHAFSARRKREGCIRIEAPLPSSHTNSSLFPRMRRRILTCSSCTTPPGHCHPPLPFHSLEGCYQGIVLTRRNSQWMVGMRVVWPHACLLRIIFNGHRDNSGFPCKSPQQACYGLETLSQGNVHGTRKSWLWNTTFYSLSIARKNFSRSVVCKVQQYSQMWRYTYTHRAGRLSSRVTIFVIKCKIWANRLPPINQLYRAVPHR